MPEETPQNLDELLKLHPADLADQIQRLPLPQAREILLQLPRLEAGAVLVELEDEKATELLDSFSPQQLVELLQEVPARSAADILADLENEKREALLAAFPPQKAEDVRALLRYGEDTAGGIMNDRFIALRPSYTVQESQQRLREWSGHKSEDISYLYVTDEAQRLVGVVPLRELVFARPEQRIGELMNRDVKFVRADDDQEEIARQFQHYHYLGLPVVGRQGRLRGVVKASDALKVAQAEATEDMQLMVGLSGEERVLTPWRRSMSKRLPWLYVNLATAFLAAAVVGWFEETIAKWTVLAVFLPIVAGQGGNAGMQTLTVIIRDLALGEVSPGDGRKALVKELTLGVVNGIAIGLVVGLIGYLWKGQIMLGIVVGLAMVLNQIAAGVCGVLIPFGLRAAKVDPALASSIFITTVTDVAGFFFFLGLATLLFRWSGL
jgi:magnesium transporter